MKKKIATSIVAFALAMSMPAAAFAAVSPENVLGTGADKTQQFDTDGQLASVDEVVVKGNVINATITPTDNVQQAVADVADKFATQLDKKVANEDLTQYEADQKAIQFASKALEYEKIVNDFMATDNAEMLDTFVMNGTVKNGTAAVTYLFDKNQVKPGDKVTYVILHEDGSIQYATTVATKDALGNVGITINMKSFSAFALMNTPAAAVIDEVNIPGVDGVFASADKNIKDISAATEKGKSPQTGC